MKHATTPLRRLVRIADPYPQVEFESVYCGDCSGSGEGLFDGSTCGTCRGSGEVMQAVSDEERADEAWRDAVAEHAGPFIPEEYLP